MRYLDMAYRGPGERRVLKREADWIVARGETFIQGYSGGAPEELKKRLKKIYILLNKLSNVPSHVGAIHRLQQQAARLRDSDQYKGLDAAHRARLQSEDLVKLQTKIGARRTRIATALAQVRAGLMALGLKLR